MKPHAFIAYSIAQSDAHMVYELGNLVEKQGFEAIYSYDHPDHPRGQHLFDEIAVSGLFVGLVTSGINSTQVIQLWQYARSQRIPAVILREQGVNLPGEVSRNPDVITFRRYMPENPIQRIELWVSHVFR